VESIDMKRLIIACLTLACGLFWLAAGAPVFGGSNLLGSGVLGKLSSDVSEAQSGQGAEAPSSGDVTELLPGQGVEGGRSFRALGAPAYPREEGDEVERVLFANEAIQAMTAGHEIWRGLQVAISPMTDTRRGVTHMVDLYLTPPLSYEGEVPTMSDPCKGHFGPDERLDPDDPCHNEQREYGMEKVSWHGVGIVHVAIDIDRGEVVRIFPSAPLGSSYISGEDRKRAEEILSANKVIQAMTAGREIGNGMEVVASSLRTYRTDHIRVELYFTPPVSYEGQVPTMRNDPCTQALRADGRVSVAHPCQNEPRVVEAKEVSWRDIDGLYVTIDLESGEVVSIKELRLPW
jgi:hypothetical protein